MVTLDWKKGAALVSALEQSSKSSVNGIFPVWADIMGAYRFLRNKKVTEAALLENLTSKCAANAKGKRVLIFSDTTDFNIQTHKNRITDFTGLGSIGSNHKLGHPPGFFLQGLLVAEAKSKFVLGWANNYLYNRALEKEPYTRANSSVPIEEKESYKWLGPSIYCRDEVLRDADYKVFVMDQESDIYEVIDRLPNENTAVLIRSHYNRYAINIEGEKTNMYDDLKGRKIEGNLKINLESDIRTRIKRQAIVEVKYAEYQILRPKHSLHLKTYREQIKVNCIEIKEDPKRVPKGEKQLHWYLLTTLEVNNIDQAIEIISYYKARWNIEEMFRIFKTEGFNIEATELESGRSIRKLLLLIMDASIKIMQLKSARDGLSLIDIKQVFTKREIECLKVLNDQYQGVTEKLKNPHTINSLSWASWIIARIGGWKGFKSQRPPGTITFKRGLERFKDMYVGYKLSFEIKDVYKR